MASRSARMRFRLYTLRDKNQFSCYDSWVNDPRGHCQTPAHIASSRRLKRCFPQVAFCIELLKQSARSIYHLPHKARVAQNDLAAINFHGAPTCLSFRVSF